LPTSVIFIDGWTGKGAITQELADSLRRHPQHHFRPDLAVLADPGYCASIFGTRDDYLIPSACLNSTVSGLVSRTVLNRDLIGENDFHGAKFYPELRSSDVSAEFLDAVTEKFASVQERVAHDWPLLATDDWRPTWAGRSAVQGIGAEFGISDLNLIKPGVGETTRVLLRRAPWKILMRTGAPGLDHIRWLAAERHVDVIERRDLPFSCIGIIHPGQAPEIRPSALVASSEARG
jgi:hypothetical protein